VLFLRFVNMVVFTPLVAWGTMLALGAFRSFWDFLPLLGYSQTVVVIFALGLFSFWYEDDKMPMLFKMVFAAINAALAMLVLGFLHGAWEWIPPLGYIEVLLINIPMLIIMFLGGLAFMALGLLGVLVKSTLSRF
jgi:hypothetical protein